MKWEYRVDHVDYFKKDVNGKTELGYEPQEELNSIGEEGWELVSVIDDGADSHYFTAFFKRPREEGGE